MTIKDAYFAVQHNGEQYKCKGRDLKDKLQIGDTVAVHRSGTTYRLHVREIFAITHFGDLTINNQITKVTAGDYTFENALGTGDPSPNYKFYINGSLVQEGPSKEYNIKANDVLRNVYCELHLTESSVDHPATPSTDISTSNTVFIPFTLDPGVVDPNAPTSGKSVTVKNISHTSPVAPTFTYKWIEGSSNQVATTKTYTVSPTLIGKKLKCQVTATVNYEGNRVSVTETTPQSANVKPHTVTFTKTGTLSYSKPPRPGTNISVTSHTVSGGYSPYTYKYEWVRKGATSNVLKTSSSYTVVNGDVTKQLRRKTTVTDKYGITAFYNTPWSDVVDYKLISLTKWGDWKARNVGYGTKAVWQPTTYTGGNGNATSRIVYKQYRVYNQFAAKNINPTIGSAKTLTGAQLRNVICNYGGTSPTVTLDAGKTMALRVFHTNSSHGGKSLYRKMSERNGTPTYGAAPKGFIIVLQFRKNNNSNYSATMKVKHKSRSYTYNFSRSGLNKDWVFKLCLQAGTGNYTDFEIQNNNASGSNVQIRVMYIMHASYVDYWHNASAGSGYPGTTGSAPCSYFGSSSAPSNFIDTITSNDGSNKYNKKIPEGYVFVTGQETVDGKGYGDLPGAVKYTGIKEESREGVCAQMEYYRIGSTNAPVSVDVDAVDVTDSLPEDNNEEADISSDGLADSVDP